MSQISTYRTQDLGHLGECILSETAYNSNDINKLEDCRYEITAKIPPVNLRLNHYGSMLEP
jgi:hypothetical protein